MKSEIRNPNSENRLRTLDAWLAPSLPSPSPRPSPLGRGSPVARRGANPHRFDLAPRGKKSPLSPGVRAGVRGNKTFALPIARCLRSPFGLRNSAFFRPSGFGLRLLPLLALLLPGCAVGPNYHQPAALGTNAMPPAFTGAASTNTALWQPAQPAAQLPRGSWWEMFGDAELNHLETLATTNNQQLAAALANFQQARALVKVARADFFPQLSADPSLTRQRISANQSAGAAASSRGFTFDTFSVPLDASWELDLWGRVRREVEGARATLAASADDLESSKLAIQAEVAADYFSLRSLDAQDQLLQETVVAYRRSLELTENRRNGGIATDLDVSQAQTQLATTQAQIPAVQLQRATFLHALAVLCGEPAPAFSVNATRGALAAARQALVAGPAIPLSVPSALLEHRPDIAGAERSVAAANANVGLAYAAFYPRVVINGLAGFQSVDASTLFKWDSRVWSVGPSLTLPLFTGGRNRAQLAAARAAYDATVANYRQTVLSAFQDVEDQLSAQHLLARQLEAENEALKSARRTLDISMDKYKGGVITYLDVVVAQSAALSLEQTVVQLNAQRLSASVSLIKALGAGWGPDTAQAEAAAPKK